MAAVLDFAGNHPVVAVILGVCLIGWSGRIIVAMIKAL